MGCISLATNCFQASHSIHTPMSTLLAPGLYLKLKIGQASDFFQLKYTKFARVHQLTLECIRS